MQGLTLKPVAIAHTPFNEKFGIPRQSGLVDVPATIELLPPFNNPEAVDGLEQVSHVWLTFVFSQHQKRAPALSVRPPRLGGNKKLGVFATRSSFRPNHLGQSLVPLRRLEIQQDSVLLHVTGLDLLNGTPIVDIKPYLPYADIFPEAFNHIADAAPDSQALSVIWTTSAFTELKQLSGEVEAMKTWITDLIALDPRPAYKQKQSSGEYGMTVFNLNVQWRHTDFHSVEVFSVHPLNPE